MKTCETPQASRIVGGGRLLLTDNHFEDGKLPISPPEDIAARFLNSVNLSRCCPSLSSETFSLIQLNSA
jgi:hypothetical protein